MVAPQPVRTAIMGLPASGGKQDRRVSVSLFKSRTTGLAFWKYRRKLPLVSGPITPCSIDVDTETSSATILKLNLGESTISSPSLPKASGVVFADRHLTDNTRLSICYCSQDQLRSKRSTLGRCQKPSVRCSVPFYTSCTTSAPNLFSFFFCPATVHDRRTGLGRHPFSEPFTSTGGLLHIP